MFDFGSYRHPDFEENPEWLLDQAFQEFSRKLRYCQEHGILLVYPSSALVYEKDTQFSKFKKTLEQMASCYKTRTIGLRIFPVYGPRESGTVIAKWCRDMAQGKPPTVYGDGTQTRDFIYVDDAADQILSLVHDQWRHGVFDIGTGISTSFNSIVEMINRALGTDIQPQYVQRPSSYSAGIHCANPLPSKVSVETGIQRILGLRKEAPACCFSAREDELVHLETTRWGVGAG